ncbi:hypothetical protein WS86_19930 [Burkholderia savannae]|nr:hypothetical protein WS86_19930 [Burkholderia savannae]
MRRMRRPRAASPQCRGFPIGPDAMTSTNNAPKAPRDTKFRMRRGASAAIDQASFAIDRSSDP